MGSVMWIQALSPGMGQDAAVLAAFALLPAQHFPRRPLLNVRG